MKFILLSVLALACVSAFPYDKTVIQNLEDDVKPFHDSLVTANSTLAAILNSTSACPCNVFDAYALDQIPVFLQEFGTCQEAPNVTECIMEKMCRPFKTLAGNPCGGFFNKSLATNYPDRAALVNGLLGECEKLMGEAIAIDDTCQANQVEDYTVFAVNVSVADSNLIQYHVIKGAYTVSNLFQKNFVQSVYEDQSRPQYVEVVVVEEGNTTVRVVTDSVAQTYANVTRTFLGSNGFVHLLAAPMSLPKSPSDVLAALPQSLSNLTSAVVALNLAATLDGMDVLTLLAPVDSGFANFPFFANLTNGLQVQTLQSHIITSPTPVFSTDVIQSNGAIINTTSGLALEIKVDGDNVGFVSPTDSSDMTYVVVADVITTNGVIHIVDAVLRPITDSSANNAVDNLFLDERLSSFASLIADSAPAFLETLKTAENVTLFAPQNLTASSMLGISEVEALLDYHKLNMEIMADQLKEGQNVATTSLNNSEFVRLDGAPQNLIVMVNNGSVQLHSTYASNDVDVTFPNLVSANNVVIHVVSSPAQVPTDTVSTLRAGGYSFLAESFANNTELAKMVNGIRPNQYNNDTSKFTLFAAADEAYSSLSAEANSTELTVLQDQLLLGRVLSGDLLAQLNGTLNISMISGRNVIIELKGADLYVDGWKVLETDVLTANGVIHILEGAVGTSAPVSDGLSAGVLAAVIVGGVAFLGLLCYCFFMKGEDGSAEETAPFARIP
jgi:uncharacterized surface protein with fasciclin (FAS1) repeats